MTQTAAPDVTGLLERVIADPVTLCERILQQLLQQLAGELTFEGDGVTAEEAIAVALGNRLAEAVGGGPEAFGDGRSREPDGPRRGGYEELLDRNTVLAAALGACECWGETADCPICRGDGTPGWVPPDEELFESFVEPASRALTRGNGARTAGPQNAEHDPKEAGDV